MRTFAIPPAVQRDEEAIQMLTARIAEKGLHCTLNVGVWHAQGHNEAAAGGTLLADIIRHVGNAIRDELGVEPPVTIGLVVRALLAELKDPTSPLRGSFHVCNS